MTLSPTKSKNADESTSVHSVIQRNVQNRMDEHEDLNLKNLCEISDLSHLKEKQLARKETQLQSIKNSHLNGLVKLEVILLPILIEIERKYING